MNDVRFLYRFHEIKSEFTFPPILPQKRFIQKSCFIHCLDSNRRCYGQSFPSRGMRNQDKFERHPQSTD